MRAVQASSVAGGRVCRRRGELEQVRVRVRVKVRVRVGGRQGRT